jgi:hypothetical protein
MSNYQESQEAYGQADGYPQAQQGSGGYEPAGMQQGGGPGYPGQGGYQPQQQATSQFPGQWYADQSQHRGGAFSNRQRNVKSSLKTTEFWVFVVVSIALLIAAAVSDGNNGGGFGSEAAWKYVTLLAAAYIVSRGLTKFSGREEADDNNHR